jgi:hypothetical protein
LFSLTITHCECKNSPSTDEQPVQPRKAEYTGPWVEGKMEVVGNQLKLAIQQFKNKAAGLVLNKNLLFQAFTISFTIDQMNEHGRSMQYGKFLMNKTAKSKALEEAVVENMDLDKMVVIIPNKPMQHKVSSGDTKVFTTNFGDSNLFFGYKRNLFAQDEVQIAEMPHLAMLKHTYDSKLRTQPDEAFLCINVPRYVDLDTKGIYGNQFGSLQEGQLQEILKKQILYRNPITYHHIISIAAPTDLSPGQPYQLTNFSRFFLPAFCAYQAARQVFPNDRIQIETGNWGAGAFGNDIRMAAISQILAAALSGAHLVIYPYSQAGRQDWQEGIQLLKDAMAGLQKTGKALTASNIFQRAQEIATSKGNTLRKRHGNGT